MAVLLHQWTAALYLAAGLLAWLGMALRAPRLERGAVLTLLAGAALHVLAFTRLHELEPTPPLTDLPTAVSFMACVGTLFFLALMRWLRLAGLAVLVAPLAFVSVFFAALRLREAAPEAALGSGSWPHAHVLLASAGLALLGVSGLAGALYLTEHRRLKAKRPLEPGVPLPSLEALDRVNRVALAAGFPLLTLGVVAGMIWVESVYGRPWTGAHHETWSALAWAVYAVLAALRFAGSQGARQAAASAVGGFALLLFAVIGVELLA
jgi:ABC-type transport system involved in cytochrome c biogenesis permease subunit